MAQQKPQIPTFEQFQKDRHSAGGVLSRMLTGGVSEAFSTESDDMAAYNRFLNRAYGIEPPQPVVVTAPSPSPWMVPPQPPPLPAPVFQPIPAPAQNNVTCFQPPGSPFINCNRW